MQNNSNFLAEKNQALLIAIEENDMLKAKQLLDEGAAIEATDEYGKTPLMMAVMRNNIELATFLLEKGANTEAKNNDEETPLNVAHIINIPTNGAMIKLLLDHGANVNTTDKRGRTPLHKVASASNSWGLGGRIEVLVEYGANISAEDSNGKTPLDFVNDKDKFLSYAERNNLVKDAIVFGDKKLQEKRVSKSSSHSP